MLMECKTCTINKDSAFHKKAFSFVLALFSKRDKELSKQRFERCLSWRSFPWEKTVLPCEYLVEKNGRYFCNECGCPQSGPMSYFSELKRKTAMTKATCPMDRWDN